MNKNIYLIEKLNNEKALVKDEWVQLFTSFTPEDQEAARQIAQKTAIDNFGRKIFFRGIVEYSNICRNDCLYCGIRKGNTAAARYRLTKEDILDCCREGYKYGYRTFVLQGGEDGYFTDEIMCDIVSSIHNEFPECAITLSIGERSRISYERLYEAGANRFLLRHETANENHYRRLHPDNMSFKNRIRCLYDLKEIGYQTGCGMMIGAPFQKAENLAEDMIFMKEFEPAMIGTGPFIPHHDTPFANYPMGSVKLTIFVISLIRIMLPKVLLPATTALGTAKGDGRKLGVLAGANVIMPNLSPISVRKKYMLYDNKAINGEDAGENLKILNEHISEIGYELVSSRGDYQGYEKDKEY